MTSGLCYNTSHGHHLLDVTPSECSDDHNVPGDVTNDQDDEGSDDILGSVVTQIPQVKRYKREKKFEKLRKQQEAVTQEIKHFGNFYGKC